MEEFYTIRQGSNDVNQYYTELKVVWDEIEVPRPTPNWNCVPTCNPNCNTLKTVQNHIATECVIKFLKGLNDSLSQVRSHVLMMKPLPTIEEEFFLVIQFKRQQKNVINQVQDGISSFLPNVTHNVNVAASAGYSLHGGNSGNINQSAADVSDDEWYMFLTY